MLNLLAFLIPLHFFLTLIGLPTKSLITDKKKKKKVETNPKKWSTDKIDKKRMNSKPLHGRTTPI